MPIDHLSASQAPRCIAMLNQKGGVGKTTSTVNLGHALARRGKRVCLVDLDPQAHLTLHLGVDPQAITHSVYDVLTDPSIDAADAIINARENLDVLPAETDLAGAETELASYDDRLRILRVKFSTVATRYDVVLMDCPPSLGLLTLNALVLADEVFVPMQAHFLPLQGVGKLLETVGLVCREVNPALRVGAILLCMHEQQTTLAREVVADLESFLADAEGQGTPWTGCELLRPAVRRNVKLAEAPSFGRTIFDYEPTCPGAQDYEELAGRVAQRVDEARGAGAVAPRDEPQPEAPQQGRVDSDEHADSPAPEVVTRPVPRTRDAAADDAVASDAALEAAGTSPRR